MEGKYYFSGPEWMPYKDRLDRLLKICPMNPFLQNTLRFAKTLGVLVTLVTMLLVSSTQGAFEECSEESVCQEIELVLGRRDQRQSEESCSRSQLTHADYCRPFQIVAAIDQVPLDTSERANMNGSGSYLII